MGGSLDGMAPEHSPRARILQLRRHAVFRVDSAKVGSNRQTPTGCLSILSAEMCFAKSCSSATSSLNKFFKMVKISLITGRRYIHSPGFCLVVPGKHCRTSSRNRCCPCCEYILTSKWSLVPQLSQKHRRLGSYENYCKTSYFSQENLAQARELAVFGRLLPF